MGHLADLETAVVHLKKYGLETCVVASQGNNIVCQVAGVYLTDRRIVELHKHGKFDESGLRTIGLIPRTQGSLYKHE